MCSQNMKVKNRNLSMDQKKKYKLRQIWSTLKEISVVHIMFTNICSKPKRKTLPDNIMMIISYFFKRSHYIWTFTSHKSETNKKIIQLLLNVVNNHIHTFWRWQIQFLFKSNIQMCYFSYELHIKMMQNHQRGKPIISSCHRLLHKHHWKAIKA